MGYCFNLLLLGFVVAVIAMTAEVAAYDLESLRDEVYLGMRTID